MGLVIRDPIHGPIHVEDWALPALESPVMQRLRRVAQLGTAHLVYPGAHHKRFEHSLGAHHLAGRFARALALDDADRRTAQAAALLHDVGHGPFSHAFEEIVRENGRRHEDMSVDLVRWGPLADLLRQGGLDPVAVAQAIQGKGPLGPLVAGALDADRLDYLLRDAHYTGVPSAADPARLIDVLARHPEGGFVLRSSGITAAEGILVTRFLMYPAVYLHHTVRASECMLLAGVRQHLAGGADVRELERETDEGLLGRLRRGGAASAEWVRLLEERRLHKRAFEGGPELADLPLVKELQKDANRRLALGREIAEAAGVDPTNVLVDVPRPPRFREADLQVEDTAGALRPLSEASRLVRVLQEARLDHWRFWVFSPKHQREAVGTAARRIFGAPSTPFK